MTDLSGFADESASLGQLAGRMTLVAGSAFCISGPDGDVSPSMPHGLFIEDTRFLSRFELRIDGRRPETLAAVAEEMHGATVVARTPRDPDGRGGLLLLRRRSFEGRLLDRVTIRNAGRDAVRCEVAVAADTDFASVFEVKEERTAEPRDVVARSTPGSIELEPADRGHRTLVAFDRRGTPGDGLVAFEAEVPPKGEWTLTIEVDGWAGERDVMSRGWGAGDGGRPVARPAQRLRAPTVSSDDRRIPLAFGRAVTDLSALQIVDARFGDEPVLAAGAPWFMTPFGRDSLLASRMALIVDPSLALSTLRVLAALQGADVDDRTEEQPGRILHEVRFGRAALLGPGGSELYFGTADATPLFVALTGELARWGVAPETIAPLLPHVDRALEWIDSWGDEDGDGYVEYRRRSEHGLANQGWKDSHDAISFADGRLADAPIALCEVQAYVYAAFLARADLADLFDETDVGMRWRERAAELRARFNRDFWLEERGWYALALDRDKRPVDALASNMAHALWCGIADDRGAASVVAHLRSPELFTGWGLRTLARSMERYDPLSYHNGSVWPHDTAIGAAGAMRHGATDAAMILLEALLDLGAWYDPHLPELFTGLARDEVARPVDYPASSSPQAWAAASIPFALQTLLRLEPRIHRGILHLAPVLPADARRLRLEGVDLGLAGRVTIHLDPEGVEVDGLAPGVRLVREPRRPDEDAFVVAE